VLRVIARLNIGGPAHHVSMLSGRLDRARFHTLLAYGSLGPGEGSFESLARKEGCVVTAVPGLTPRMRPHADMRALIEASAAGRPAVATAVGGVPDVVIPGTGVLVPAGDHAALAGAVARLARDAELRADMGARARKHVVGRFSIERLLADVERLYDELLDSAHAQGTIDPGR
jgi:glycosyltransferase involved in cell wall biosynthesis